MRDPSKQFVLFFNQRHVVDFNMSDFQLGLTLYAHQRRVHKRGECSNCHGGGKTTSQRANDCTTFRTGIDWLPVGSVTSHQSLGTESPIYDLEFHHLHVWLLHHCMLFWFTEFFINILAVSGVL